MAVPDLESLARRLAKDLDAKDAARERARGACRGVQRSAKLAIQRFHANGSGARELRQAVVGARAVRRELSAFPGLMGEGFVAEALEELAEAGIVHALLHRRPLPSPERLGVTPEAYVLGMGDAIGELRRACLARLASGELAAAEQALAGMESLYLTLMRFDHPAALAHVRRKQDVARALVERTQGELTVAIGGRRLEKRIEELGTLLDELEGKKKEKSKKRKSADEELDVDQAWGR